MAKPLNSDTTPDGANAAPILLRRDDDGVATLTMNRPKARNALSVGLMAEMKREIDAIAADDTIRVVVIAADGPAYCAGHDLREMRGNPGREQYQALFSQCSELMLAIIRLPKPVIAKVHAMATAAGCQLVASCDLAIAARDAKFATPGVNIGLFCSTPMVALTRNIGRKPAMQMLLTGEPIDADRAEQYGLINRAVENHLLDAETDALAAAIKQKSPLTIAIGKEAFYRQLDMDLPEAYAYVSEVMTRNMLSRDAGEGIDAFLEKRRPEWEGR
jgi:enoyl-CoA hydratase/carnithine racemase